MTPPFGIDHPAAQYSGDDWDELIRSANRLTVRSIDNFRAEVTFKDLDVRPKLRASSFAQVSGVVLKSLDS